MGRVASDECLRTGHARFRRFSPMSVAVRLTRRWHSIYPTMYDMLKAGFGRSGAVVRSFAWTQRMAALIPDM